MTSPTQQPAPGGLAARLILPALLLLLPMLPPETRGESLLGSAILIALLALLCWPVGATGRSGHLWLALAAILALPAGWISLAPGAAVRPVTLALLAGGAVLAARRLAGDERVERHAVLALAAAASVAGGHALFQRFRGLESLAEAVRSQPDLPDQAALVARLESGRAYASFATPAALGGLFCLTLPLCVALAVSTRGRERWLWGAATGLQLGGLLAASSATAVAAILGAVLLAGFLDAGRRRLLTASALALTLLLVLVAVGRGGKVLDPMDPESPWRLRAGNIRSAWNMATDHPWTGVGPGAFSEIYPAYRQEGDNETRHAHNLPVELFADLGFVAGGAVSALFFLGFVGPLVRARGKASPWRRGVAVGLAAFAIQNLGDFTAFMPSLLWTAALLAGLLWTRDAAPGEEGGGRLVAGIGLAAVVVASIAAGLGGLSWNARVDARRAAFADDPDRAARRAERAVRLAPWDVEAALLLARLTSDATTDGGLALERADRVVALSPVRPAARELRATVRMRNGDPQGALADLTVAARLYPLQSSYRESRDLLRRRIEEARAGLVESQ